LKVEFAGDEVGDNARIPRLMGGDFVGLKTEMRPYSVGVLGEEWRRILARLEEVGWDGERCSPLESRNKGKYRIDHLRGD
jgi:hypothetical protein